MKKIAIVTALIILFSFAVEPVNAAKTLPQAKGAKTTVSKKMSGSGISVTPKLRGDRRALLIYFSSLQNANRVSYLLTYQTNDLKQGVEGSVNPSEGSATRETLFGTCSANVCRYHDNITNMKLEVTAQLKSGKNLIKRYKIRI